MFNKNIKLLESKGFTIDRQPNFTTKITHNSPFMIESSGPKPINAIFEPHTAVYSMTFVGYPNGGDLKEGIQQFAAPLVREISSIANSLPTADDIKPEPVITLLKFTDVLVGESYTKEGNDHTFKKVSDSSSIVETRAILPGFEKFEQGDTMVFVQEGSDMAGIRPSQRADIVNHAPKGLSYNEFAEHVSMEFENIAGMEGVEDTSELINSLYAMYMSTLTSSEKGDIIKHAPKGLSYDDFAEHVSMEFENIAGMEGVEDTSELINSLYAMYTA